MVEYNFETPDELIACYQERLKEASCSEEERKEIKGHIKTVFQVIHAQRQSTHEAF